MRGRWAPPPPEGAGSREEQREPGRGQQASPAADSNTIRRHAKAPPLDTWLCGLGMWQMGRMPLIIVQTPAGVSGWMAQRQGAPPVVYANKMDKKRKCAEEEKPHDHL